jgi:hypothetical protein
MFSPTEARLDVTTRGFVSLALLVLVISIPSGETVI